MPTDGNYSIEALEQGGSGAFNGGRKDSGKIFSYIWKTLKIYWTKGFRSGNLA